MLFPSPGDLSYLGLEPGSPALQADSLLTELQGNSIYIYIYIYIYRERERERERDFPVDAGVKDLPANTGDMGSIPRLGRQSMGFLRQDYWSGVPISFSRDLLKPGIKPDPPALSSEFLTTEPPGKPGI